MTVLHAAVTAGPSGPMIVLAGETRIGVPTEASSDRQQVMAPMVAGVQHAAAPGAGDC
jgi:hypothetical protein